MFIENLKQSFSEYRKIMCIHVKKGLYFKYSLCVIMSACPLYGGNF